MKTRFISIAIASLMAMSCSTTKYFVASNYKLDTVENSATESMIKASSQTYADDVIDVAMQFGENAISLTLANNTGSSLKILWDDAAYIDQFGSAHRVIHLGTKLVDRDKAQVPSVVPKGSKINDEVVPSDCIQWVTSSSKYVSSDWKYTPIEQMYIYKTQKEAESATVSFGPVKLMLPIEVDGKRYEYTFIFINRDTHVGSVKEVDTGKTLLASAAIGAAAALLVEISVLSTL